MLFPSPIASASLAFMLVSLSAPAAAQSMNRIDQRAWIQLGAARAHVDSSLRADYVGDPALGLPPLSTTLDFEDDLKLDRSHTVPNIVLGVRLFERWRVEFETYRLRRTATQTLLDEAVTIDGTTYSASARLNSEFMSRVQRLTLGYSLLKTPSAELGVALGVQYTRYRLRLEGVGQVDNGPPEVRSAEEGDKGPLPTVGLYGSFALGSAWSAAGRVDYLPVESRRVNGYLGSVEANVYHRLSPNWTVGVGYRYIEYRVDRKATGDVGGRFEYRFRGPQVLLEAGF